METIKLSNLISELKNSLEKLPRVKNYAKIKYTLLPGLEDSLSKKGDISIPLAGLAMFIS